MKELPYSAWILMPSFKPVEVLIERETRWYVTTSRGKDLAPSKVFACQAEAIDSGWEQIKKQQVDIEKKLTAIEKKKAALHKAENGLMP